MSDNKRTPEYEQWKDIYNYEGIYQVSSAGRIKSLKRRGCKNERILTPHLNNNGYYFISLCRNGVCKNVTVHRLVALAFIPEVKDKLQVNHINGEKTDNRVSNLEWVNNREDVIHSFKTHPHYLENLRSEAYLNALNQRRKIKPVNQYSLDGKLMRSFTSVRAASLATGVSKNEIYFVCSDKYPHRISAGGFKWEWLSAPMPEPENK